jgi:hypothetical protein
MARSVQSSAYRPYSPNLVEGGLCGHRSLTEFCDVNTIPTDPLSLFSEWLAIVGLFGARRLSQQSLAFPSPEEAPTLVYTDTETALFTYVPGRKLCELRLYAVLRSWACALRSSEKCALRGNSRLAFKPARLARDKWPCGL